MSRFKNIKEFIKTKHFVKQIGLVILTYLLIVGGTLLYLDIRTHHGENIAVPRQVFPSNTFGICFGLFQGKMARVFSLEMLSNRRLVHKIAEIAILNI